MPKHPRQGWTTFKHQQKSILEMQIKTWYSDNMNEMLASPVYKYNQYTVLVIILILLTAKLVLI